MRALLVQSPATSPWVPRRQWEPPSVAMATIAGQIDNHDVRVADMVVWRKQAVPRFLQVLREFKPDVVGFTSMTFQYDTTVGFAYLTKQFDSRIRTVLGGYHATLFSESIAAGPDANFWDFLVRGEGDFAFGELLNSIEAEGKGMENILGLSYKEEDRFRHNPPRPLEDLDKIRIPARDKRLAKGFHMYFRRADVIETSRGCLHLCNFCSIREMYGRSFRLFPSGPRSGRHRRRLQPRRPPHFLHRRQHHPRYGTLRAVVRRRHWLEAEEPDLHHPGESDWFRPPARRCQKNGRGRVRVHLPGHRECVGQEPEDDAEAQHPRHHPARRGRPAERRHYRHRRHYQWASG